MTQTKPVVLIVGAGSRMGLPLIRKYQDKNYRVIATSRRPIAVDDLEDVTWQQLDITKVEDCQRVIPSIVANNKGVDTLVICAGYYPAEPDFVKQSLEDLFLDIDVTYKGSVTVSKVFVDANQQYKKGDIVFISSSGGAINSGGSERVVHCANKAAINRFAETLNGAIKPLGMRAFNIIPGQLSGASDADALLEQGAIAYDAIADVVIDVTHYTGNAHVCTVEVTPSFKQP